MQCARRHQARSIIYIYGHIWQVELSLPPFFRIQLAALWRHRSPHPCIPVISMLFSNWFLHGARVICMRAAVISHDVTDVMFPLLATINAIKNLVCSVRAIWSHGRHGMQGAPRADMNTAGWYQGPIQSYYWPIKLCRFLDLHRSCEQNTTVVSGMRYPIMHPNYITIMQDE